ncbi:hypothetical protein DMB95_01320 [Campylobacter sp. MIT 12-8780]|uniref:thiol:disulfide interchange protein DsbA/DsbL n=1 Tax=unclassified Campylobacter TaxID=2593542 RepID=UPI00115CFD2E|nr:MULTISPECIES: thiol:disulfide interchange protein DsbA/DsbL [unclassified Campylobacter]NDJ26601.1 thiol:disulfide interchange protein DsbA/DsbL [Campylobacter sp. MIT 19-121]TQR43166.1 hypothetical protein DMB95_01320 [Campylobacter sp. MIT 12-8780]
MKKFKALLLVAFMTLNAFALSEGKEYEVLKTPIANEQNSVIEVFSFSCIACYTHHKFNTLAKIKEKLPNLNTKLYPVKGGQFGEEFAQLYAYALAKDTTNKKNILAHDSLTHKLSDAYYTALFERKQNYANSASFSELGLKTLGISKAELERFLASAEGQKVYNDFDKSYGALSQYGGTPTFIVGGKYIIKMAEIKGLDELIKVVDELIKQK